METYNCTICPAKFKTQKGLENHKCRWICSRCHKKLTTAKGFARHESNCGETSSNKVNAELLRIERQNQQIEKYNSLKAAIIERGLFNPAHKVGDTVFVSTYYITKPTHKWNGRRMVHVRYEEERKYNGLQTVIEDVQMSTSSYSLEMALAGNAQASIYYKVARDQKFFTENDFFESLDAAENDALKHGVKYKEACDFASMCR